MQCSSMQMCIHVYKTALCTLFANFFSCEFYNQSHTNYYFNHWTQDETFRKRFTRHTVDTRQQHRRRNTDKKENEHCNLCTVMLAIKLRQSQLRWRQQGSGGVLLMSATILAPVPATPQTLPGSHI